MFFIIRGRRKAEQLNKKLILKNEEVNQQNEEITAIAENLREANEENLAQNKALSAAFDEIAKKNADITSSIIYAQRIQRAILPPLSLFESTFADSFVFFKPRDIVSGDFYWLRKSEDETFAVIAVADCTGHGVPGAFMSMIGHDLLNEIFISKKIFKPAEILRSLDFSLKNALRQKDTSVNDGMDIVVCTVFFQEQKLFFAGAKNDMYVVENDTISTLKGSNFALGGQETAKEKIFDEQEISAQNKIFYLATDGFQDQFGGSEGKKFMSRNLKALLLKNSRLSFNAQAKELEVSLEAWKSEGKEKQIDDVLIVGFRI
jgi:serine phosphatase RsbU (regulator of sigma subunit)